MTLKVVISHKTFYQFDRLVTISPHVFRLRPAPHSRTPIYAYSMKIKPEKQFFNWQQDPFGNYQARLVFPEKSREMSIEVEIIADLTAINPFDFFVEESAKYFPFKYDRLTKRELNPYLKTSRKGKLFSEWLNSIDRSKKITIDFLIDINQKINNMLKYNIRMQPGVQSCEVTLRKKSGSCRDFAWLLVQTLRHLGFGARFVSGYLVQLKADVKSLDGPSGPEEDFTDLHAWAEVYVPGAGWIGLDSTSGLLAGEGHIPLACTPSFEGAAPVTGTTDICKTVFSYENTVKRIFESPRVTKPYTDNQWLKINQLGEKVENELQKNDVRLTMGGEPTFVSIDDMESAQWNTEADGEEKRKRAIDLSKKLLKRFGKGGVLHHPQGKWYPGEILPRWEIALYWRKDGNPIWKNPNLLGTPNSNNQNINISLAKNFLQKLCDKLSVDQKYLIPGYEDAFYFYWEKEKLPTDLEPENIDLKSPPVMQKLTELLNKGLSEPAGFALPLHYGKQGWDSSDWKLKRKRLVLIPGNSPMGLRLPLESLMLKPEREPGPVMPKDNFSSLGKLPESSQIIERRNKTEKFSTFDASSGNLIRTALCIEPRAGSLYVFLPPLESSEAFLDLVCCIEAVSAQLNVQIILEGYSPPEDHRIQKLKVTPDPGVIEVNIHPSQSWSELCENTFALYKEAELSRLGTQKFMLDGKHTGTGGGNHVTLGGATPSDSPLLRRPDLLRSLITYWQHHPGLSYLFSGAFIGPTSQAPRVDEGRAENLYELEIAFSQIPSSKEVPFWLTDRLFRHLLTDITGNTHRSEFCIDKLYSPDSSSGRLGILELRAFDMPPHARMSLTQMLLVRTLVVWFWQKPYKHKLIRWGTELHDRYLMEHYVREDMNDIVEQLNREGYPLELDWFNPFFEFRFPLYGIVHINRVELELRAAIEPWNVLGEEMTGRGTSRYVDSSVERLQVKLNNFIEDRYILTCNGVRIPLSSTGKAGEYVASIRYKAWQPWSALHPTIGVDTPLIFDILDSWNSRSLGGCTYHVSHPGGRSYETFPVNSFEAESRRISRFWDIGHSQGEITPLQHSSNVVSLGRGVSIKSPSAGFIYQEPPINLEFPHTLDLRKSHKVR